MATAFRSSQSVTNGTAGTSVTVTKPVGIVDTGTNPARDQLIAFIAATGAPTVTAPVGWTLIDTAVDAGNNVTLKAYRKLASSEGASWTWTLGTSARNWGVVEAWTGVDPTTPVSAGPVHSTTLVTSNALNVTGQEMTRPAWGVSVSAAAAVRAASGVATTWTHSGTAERKDVSTNAGAGTDISGVVGDTIETTGADTLSSPSVTASQNQTFGAFIAFQLAPYFTPYTGLVRGAGIVLEAAFGVNPDSNSSAWVWTPLTSLVHHPAKLLLTHGRANRSSQADPSAMVFTLLNLNGEFTKPGGTYTARMVLNLPFRVRLTGFGFDAAGSGIHRGTAFLASMRPRWDASTRFAVVDIVAQGRLRRAQQRTDVLKSAAYTAIQRFGSISSAVTPTAYWPFEDEAAATAAASAVPNGAPATASAVTFAADTSWVGSAPLASLAATSVVSATVPPYTATGQWIAIFCSQIPTEPAGTTTLLEIQTTGTAAKWRVDLVPGATALRIRAYDASGANILDDSGVSPTEATYFGVGHLFTLETLQSGGNIGYQMYVYRGIDGSGGFLGGGKIGTLVGYTNGNVTLMGVPAAVGLTDAGFGHLALHTSASIIAGITANILTGPVTQGNSGEWPWERFQRLCVEQNVPYTMDASANQALEMGPQGIGTFISMLREAEQVEGCVLNDSGELFTETGVLWFPARDDRENIAASLTLDVSLRQVAPDFAPILDDQDIANDIDVSRSGGSSARATDETSIASKGRYRQAVTLNLDDDTLLSNLAYLRLLLGTVTGMRFPSVSWNMRRSPELAQQWTATRLFKRIDILHPPSQYPPDNIEAILEGYTETLSLDEWSVRANLSPYAPYRIAIAEDPAAVQDTPRPGSGTAVLAVGVNTSATSLSVTTGTGGLWTTVGADFPLDINIEGERIRLSAISGSSSPQTFTVSARSQNGAVMSHLAGARIEPWLIATVGF